MEEKTGFIFNKQIMIIDYDN